MNKFIFYFNKIKLDFNKIKVYNISTRNRKEIDMDENLLPEWIRSLDENDLAFMKRFVLSSGSLKEVASQYNVTYPTVRLRLDRLIQKIQISDQGETEPYVALIKRLAIDDKLDFETAKLLIGEYRKMKGSP